VLIEKKLELGQDLRGWATIPHGDGGSEAANRNNSSWGRAGGWDYGTLCGVLTGCVNVIEYAAQGTRANGPKPLTHQLFEWYQNLTLPDFTNSPDFLNMFDPPLSTVLTSPAPRSTLCHDSISQWCTYTGIAENASERSNRCGRLTAESAYITAKLLCYNAHFGGAPSWYTASTVGAGCKVEGCHKWNVRPDVKSNCYQCHK